MCDNMRIQELLYQYQNDHNAELDNGVANAELKGEDKAK